MTSSLIAMAVLSFANAGPKLDTPVININVKDGDVISGQANFRVTVQAQSAVTKVEFYVKNDIRETDSSTPYEFSIDTLEEEDGNLKVSFAAFTQEGGRARKDLTLKVDNGVAKGADFHVQRANELLSESKWDAAIISGRVALRAKPGHNPARIALARAYMGKNVLDRAQKFAEDAVASDANDVAALDLLAGINLQRGFNTLNRGGDRKQTLTTIKDAFKSAVESRRKVLDGAVDKMGAPTDANRIAIADAAIKARRFSLAIQALQRPFESDPKRVDFANRLAYAYMQDGRLTEARKIMADLRKFGAPDAYSYALTAVIENELGNDAGSAEALREALLNDSSDLGVQTAQAYLALKDLRNTVAGTIAGNLAKDQGSRPEIMYYLMALSNRLQRYDAARQYFERSVLAEPTNLESYIEQANESIAFALNGGLEKKDADAQIENAKAMFEIALVANPSSHQALTGLAIVALLQGNPTDAVKFAQAGTAAAKTYAAAFYVLSAAHTAARNVAEAQRANLTAGQLDKKNLEGRNLPDVRAVYRYFAIVGRTPVLSAPR